jgi:hypothetical protein
MVSKGAHSDELLVKDWVQEGLAGEKARLEKVERWMAVPQAKIGSHHKQSVELHQSHIGSPCHTPLASVPGAFILDFLLAACAWASNAVAAPCPGASLLGFKTLYETFIAVWNHSGSLPNSSELTVFSATMPASIPANGECWQE